MIVNQCPLALAERAGNVNIFLLISDTFRYDNLSGRAAMPVRTPELERFAARAVTVTGSYNSSFPTIPLRTDLTSGRYSWPWHGWQNRLKSSKNHLPELLRGAGYVSQLLTDTPHLFNEDFQVGFDASFCLRGQEGDLAMLRMNYPIEHVMPPEKTRAGRHFRGANLVDLARWQHRHWYREEDRFAPRLSNLVCEWLEENYRFHPLFLWADLFDPHEPWDPPEHLVRRYDPDYAGTPMLHPNYGKADDLAPAELRNLRAHYAAEAELVDRSVGRILQKIDDLDLWSNSIVVFTSDHGTSLGEHNRTGKSNINPRDDRCWPIYPEVAHVPLLIAAPGLKGGRSVDALVQAPDLLPTLLDLAGAAVRPAEPFHGRSFAPLLRGEAQKPLHEFVISGSYLRRKPGAAPEKEVTPVLYTHEWAYVPLGPQGERQLFDLGRDPYAETDLAPRRPEVVRDLDAKLVGWLKDLDAPPEAAAALEPPR